MNIAVNCRLLQKGRLEGIGWFMYETLKRITRDHPEHNFFFIFDRPYDNEFIFSGNITPVIAGPPARHPFLWYLWMEWRIPALLKKIKADLFFSPDGYLSLRTEVPSVPVIHDINFAHRPEDLPLMTRWYYNFFFPRFARKAHRICTVSEYSKSDIHKTYKIDFPLIHVVYNGANPGFAPAGDNEKQMLRDKYSFGKPYFIFIGSLHPRKNLTNLVKAYNKYISASGSDINLLIVGSAMWNGGKEYTSEEEKPRIIYTGRLEADELFKVLAGAHAMTFVPWFEGFGIPVLEAMYSDVPVLTSSLTSLPEVAGDAALFADPGDVDEIASKMKIIADDPLVRESLINKGRKQRKKFSWDLTAHKVWVCLETVILGIEKNNAD